MTTTLVNTSDDCIEVIVELDGYVKKGIVSSMHLVEPKESQLIRAIYREAQEAYAND